MPKISQYTEVTTPTDVDELVVVQAGVTKKMTLTKLADYVDVGSKPFTTATDPALNTAATTAIVNAYSGTIITTTKAGNSQTLAAPTVVTAGKYFTVVNNDTSTHSIPFVANSVTFTITPGEGQCFLWDGSAWGPTDLGITSIPVPVTQGGSGVSTLTDHGILLGSGTGAITPLGAATNGQLPIGSTGADPVLAAITEGEAIDITNAAGAITIACEDATTANKGVTVYSGPTKALAGTDTASAMTPADVNARVAVDVNEKAMTQSVHLTAASSGSSGIQNADNADLNAGTGNFSWTGSVFQMDWTPSANQIIAQKHDGTNGWILTLLTTGVLRLTINATTYDSTIATGFADATMNKLGFLVTRSSATVAGVVRFAGNKVQIGADVAITAGAPVTVSNAVALYTMGTSAVRTAGRVSNSTFWNRALTIDEHKDWVINGPAFADKWGSQTATYTSSFTAGTDSWTGSGGNHSLVGNIDANADGAGNPPTDDWMRSIRSGSAGRVDIDHTAIITPGKKCRVTFDIFIKATSSITHLLFRESSATVTSGALSVTAGSVTSLSAEITSLSTSTTVLTFFPCGPGGTVILNIADGDGFYIKNIVYKEIGATLALQPEGIQPAPGQWLDSSSNKLHSMLPAAGASLIRSKKEFEVRWTNTWAASHEAQYIGGLNQAILPIGCYITNIIGVVSGSTIEDIIVGDGSDTDHWVAATTGLAAGTYSFAVANSISDGTNYKLVVDPDANFTGSIAWTIFGKIL